jgi:hyperosmotically inducible protein
MNKKSLSKTSLGAALLAAGLFVGLGSGAMNAAAEAVAPPQAHSDGLVAAVTDTAITTSVKAKLITIKTLKQSHISVTTTNGVVTLDGTASSAKATVLAGETAQSVEGVKSVDNNLKTPGTSEAVVKTKRVVSDSWITTKVKTEILADSVSKGFEVNVKTEHGVVLLKGSLANQDAIDHVKDIAAKIYGVKSVDTTELTVAGK